MAKFVRSLPKDKIKAILDFAKENAFEIKFHEKGTDSNPSHFQRKESSKSYEELFELINNNNPAWSAYFREKSKLVINGEDYWDFGGTNFKGEGHYYIFIYLKVSEAKKLFEKFNIEIQSF